MKVFLRDGEGYSEVKSKPLTNEAELQRLLQQHSNLIPLGLDARRQVVREFPTAAGPIDHLVIDGSGQVLVVETKLSINADRRRVIAQAIDYAAQLTKFGPQALLDVVKQRTTEDALGGWFDSLAEREDFLRNLETNLREGRLTLLIVMDFADGILKDAVRFINRATSFNCLLAEIRISELDGREVITVEVYGDETAEEKARPGSSSSKAAMDRATFVSAKTDEGMESEVKGFLQALDWAGDNGGTTGPLRSGFYLAQTPFIGYNYFGWTYQTIDVWATADVYDELKSYLENSPSPWPSRIETRTLKPGGKYGKVADVDPTGASEAEFRELFEHYIKGPRAEEKPS